MVIVRCKDCKYQPIDVTGTGSIFDIAFPIEGVCPFECDDPWYNRIPDDDFFCKNGKRRAENGKNSTMGEL